MLDWGRDRVQVVWDVAPVLSTACHWETRRISRCESCIGAPSGTHFVRRIGYRETSSNTTCINVPLSTYRKIRYVSTFTAASRGSPCDSMAFLYNKATLERLCTLNTATLSMRRLGRIWRQNQHKTPWITFGGHSRSHMIMGSLKSRRETAYCCINVGFRVGNFGRKCLSSEYLRFREPHCHSAPCLEYPCEYSHKSYSSN